MRIFGKLFLGVELCAAGANPTGQGQNGKREPDPEQIIQYDQYRVVGKTDYWESRGSAAWNWMCYREGESDRVLCETIRGGEDAYP